MISIRSGSAATDAVTVSLPSPVKSVVTVLGNGTLRLSVWYVP